MKIDSTLLFNLILNSTNTRIARKSYKNVRNKTIEDKPCAHIIISHFLINYASTLQPYLQLKVLNIIVLLLNYAFILHKP